MTSDIKIEILENGNIRFGRGDKFYNNNIKDLISGVVEGDKDIIKEVTEFLKQSEDVKLIMGDRVFCG